MGEHVSALTVAGDTFDRYARLVRDVLSVPTALVTLVEASRQVFIGALGLAEPWQTERQTPLSHSFCQHVVARDRALLIPDARLDDQLADNPAITDLGVIAYAGVPLRDASGVAVGSLCAIDSEPRQWTERDLRILSDLAAACSADLISRDALRRADEAEDAARIGADRARAVLVLSEALADTNSVGDVAAAVQMTAAELGAASAGLWLLDDAVPPQLRYVAHPGLNWPDALQAAIPLTADHPLSVTLRDRTRVVTFDDADTMLARWPSLRPAPGAPVADSVAFLALSAGRQPLGCLGLAYDHPRPFDDGDREVLLALGAYTGQAVERARLLEHTTSAALVLQRSMLTELPAPDDMQIAARYLPAAAGDLVGGDWYDAVVQPDDGALVVVIGDVFGHDINAAAGMGTVRNMLRILAVDHPELTPAQLLERLDRGMHALHARTLATVVAARVEHDGPGVRHLRWTNAGHPPPLVVDGDGTAALLEGDRIDPLLGVMARAVRHDHVVAVPADSTVLFYTDGLIETRHDDLEVGQARLMAALTRHRALPLTAMLDALISDMVGGHPPDDVAVLALRFGDPTN